MRNTNNQLTSFWNLIRSNKIVIPIIQRDYAQGRENEVNLRMRFLKSLKGALDTVKKSEGKDNETGIMPKPLILDFVYSTPMTNGEIAPFDGQQRLTTLWLLHWYLAYKTGNLSDDTKKVLKAFSYKTRISSREFCEKLCDLTPMNNDGDSIIHHIENQTWFYSEWIQDPTVKAMLVMLFGISDRDEGGDNINDVFGVNDISILKKYWEALTCADSTSCPIMFNHTIIGTEELPLSDDLYIKMNARGKPLTSFENFKAEVIKWIAENKPKEESVKIASKFDNEWTDVFWSQGKGNEAHDVDEVFFAFINRIYYLYVITEKGEDGYLLSDKNSDKNKDYRYFNGSEFNTDRLIIFQSLDGYKSNLNRILTELDTILREIKNIEPESLQCKWEKEKEFYFIPQYIINEKEPKHLTNEILDFTTINQKQRVAFYAICKYLLCLSSPTDEKESLKHWMRFVWNLISDKDSGGTESIRSISAMQQAIRLIDKIKNPRDIYNEIKERSTELLQDIKKDNQKESILGRRFKEEVEKIDQILNPDQSLPIPEGFRNWEEAIINAENFRFFNGSIGFLFHNEKGDVDWKNFERKFSNAKEYFKEENNTEVIKDMIPYLTDEDILSIFSEYDLRYNDANVGDMLRRHSSYFHNYLMGANKSKPLTRLQSDIMELCEKHPDYWIHKEWINKMHVLSNYSYKSGNYESNSYFIRTDYIKERFEFLEEVQNDPTNTNIKIEFKKPDDFRIPYEKLFIEFKCTYQNKSYKFKWTGNDWVDMIDEHGTNLWEAGLHFKYNGDENVEFFLSEIDRCIHEFNKLRG